MKTFSFGLATAIAIVLFGAFGSVGMRASASVSTHVVSMYAVLPDGALVDLRARPGSASELTRRVKQSPGTPGSAAPATATAPLG